MYNTVKLETQVQRALQSTQVQLLSENYQSSLSRGLTSYELLTYIQIRVRAYWIRRVMFLYGWREECAFLFVEAIPSNRSFVWYET